MKKEQKNNQGFEASLDKMAQIYFIKKGYPDFEGSPKQEIIEAYKQGVKDSIGKDVIIIDTEGTKHSGVALLELARASAKDATVNSRNRAYKILHHHIAILSGEKPYYDKYGDKIKKS